MVLLVDVDGLLTSSGLYRHEVIASLDDSHDMGSAQGLYNLLAGVG